MSVDLELSPKHKRAPGAACCEALVYPEVSVEDAGRLAEVARALV
jgi:ArsR family transcriptional regulator